MGGYLGVASSDTLEEGVAFRAEGVRSDAHSFHSHSEAGLISRGGLVLGVANCEILELG